MTGAQNWKLYFRLKKSHYWWCRPHSGFHPPDSCCMPHFGENQDFIHPSTKWTVISGIFIHGPSGAVLLNDLSLRSSQSKVSKQVLIPNYAVMKNQIFSLDRVEKNSLLNEWGTRVMEVLFCSNKFENIFADANPVSRIYIFYIYIHIYT